MESPLQTIERLQQQVRDLESQLAAAQQGVPERWKLVPVEPQDAQQAAGAWLRHNNA